MSSLRDALESFRALMNEKEQIRKLIKDWEPFIHLECTDDNQQYTLVVRQCALAEVKDGLVSHDHLITVRGGQDALTRIFDGSLNAAEAIIEGKIEVYGKDKDLIKLDALTLVLWEV